jgi:hypothetical protein
LAGLTAPAARFEGNSVSGALANPTASEILDDARREILLAEYREFEFQCRRLGDYVLAGDLPAAEAADGLYNVAVAVDLTGRHGEDEIQALMARGFSCGLERQP